MMKLIGKMNRLAVLVACFAVTLGASIPGDRIVGGSTAGPGQFPYQVSLRYVSTGSHTCGGSLLSSRFILTAAHCIYGQYLDELFVVVGTNSLSDGGDAYTILAGGYHPGYNPQHMVYDIALLKTSQDVQFSNVVQPIYLQPSEVPAGTPLTLSGWGLTSYPGSIPKYLQYATLTAISAQQCASDLAAVGVVTDLQICTYTRPGQGACQGDSGGPLVYGGAVVGIVSWGLPCARGYPDVFTKVSSYYNWIQQTMQTM